MDKEEILKKNYPNFDIESDWMFDGSVTDVFAAMDEFAEQEAFGFFKWYGVKIAGLIEYITKIKPTQRSEEFEEKILEFEGQTFEKLYKLYLKSKELTT